MVSVPSPLMIVSSPMPPSTVLLPLPSVIVSLPPVAASVSVVWKKFTRPMPTACGTNLASPLSPITTLLPVPPVSMSLPLPPMITSAPAPLVTVSAAPSDKRSEVTAITLPVETMRLTPADWSMREWSPITTLSPSPASIQSDPAASVS